MPGARKKKQERRDLRDAVERKRSRSHPPVDEQLPNPQVDPVVAPGSSGTTRDSNTGYQADLCDAAGVEPIQRDISGDLTLDPDLEQFSHNPTRVVQGNIMPNIDQTTAYSNASTLLSAHVSLTIKEKIWNNQFVELQSLLKKSPSENAKQTFQLVNGELIMSTKEDTSRILEKIEAWSDAFVIFMSIYLERFPNETQNLLQYFHNIRLAAAKFSGWVNYDRQFRLKMSVKPLTTSWNSVDPELWMLSMLPLSATSQFRFSGRICLNFNRRGYCTFKTCNYNHVCQRCHGPHALPFCQSSVASQTMSGPRPRGPFGLRNDSYLRPRNQTDRFRSPMSSNRSMGRQPTPGRYMGPRFYAN